MEGVFSFKHTVGYFQVDHQHRIQLGPLFQLLQEAAIHHANQYEIGTNIMEAKGESWILNRVALELSRYPKFEEEITIQTWATHLKHFKGFREFRILSASEVIGKASTLWLYIDMEKKTFARLAPTVEDTFPILNDEIHFDSLDKLRLPKPSKTANRSTVSLRYSDIDGNQHVNNAAYMDLLQTGLYHQNLDTHPKVIQIQFAKEISPKAAEVGIRSENFESHICFGLYCQDEAAAFGLVG